MGVNLFMDKRHDETVELAGIIQNKMCYEGYIFSDVAAIDAADEILNLGYHKTIWHKVAENDLPKRQGQKVWLCTISKDYFMANYWDDVMTGGKQFFEVASVGRITLSNVLAWMELPKYEEK